MRRLLASLPLLLCLGSFVPAFAANERNHKLGSYSEPDEAAREEAKRRNRRGPQEFVETVVMEEPAFPWLQVSMTLAFLGAVLPFGIYFYRRSAKEQVDANAAFTPPARRRRAAE